jgi:tol-pal system protein YbgF
MIFRIAPLFAMMIAVAAPAFGPAYAQSTGATAARVLELEDEIRRLNGRIEQLEFRMRQIAEDATRRFGDIEYRMTVLEGGDASLVGDPVPLGQSGGAASGASGGGPVTAISERAALDEGVAAVEGGDYARGRKMLENFMVTYADGPLTGEAEYWLGETYFREGNFKRAASIFLSNVTNRADHPKSAISFLHLGLSLERLGHVGEACQTFAEVARRHANDANAVAQAETERDRLVCP